MIKIAFPDKKPAIKQEGNTELIFCIVRRKWFVITPEEWVRQNVLLYLTQVLEYPRSLVAVEKQLQLGELNKRFDIVVYKADIPFMLIECKEMNVPITQKTMEQVLRYNISLRAGYFVITNGSDCYGFKIGEGSFSEIDSFPAYV